MKVYGLLLFLAFSITSGTTKNTETDQLTEGDVADMFNCLCVVTCDLRQIWEIERLNNASGPRLRVLAMSTYAKCYGYPELDEYTMLKSWDDIVCPNPIEKKRLCFIDVMKEVGIYIEVTCGKALFDAEAREDCESAENAIEEGKKIIQEHTENGDCYNPETMSKDMKEDGLYRSTGHHLPNS